MSGLSKYYLKKVIQCFAIELTATAAAEELNINRNTINKYYKQIREAIANYQQIHLKNLLPLQATNTFSLTWHKHKGLTLASEVEDDPLYYFLLIEQNGQVYVKTDDNYKQMQLTKSNSVNNNSLPTELLMNKTMRNFYYFSKEKLSRFYGVKSEYIYLYLKELEFRFNNQDKDLLQIISKILPHHVGHKKNNTAQS